MEGEFNNLVMACVSALVSLSYCHTMAKIIPKGKTRLIAIIPVIALFLFLPLTLHSLHFRGISSFFISWLANFKLLLFAFGGGPLSSDPSMSLLRFAALACLPIKIQKSPSLQEPQKSALGYTVKGVVLGMVTAGGHFSEMMNPVFSSFLYPFQMYLSLELVIALAATFPRFLLGMELTPQFNEPYLSSSLQEFWGRRWNIMASDVLRPTVYFPTLNFSVLFIGRKWAPIPAVMATFLVSAFIHELIFFYMSRIAPTWRITCFFLLHGFCLSVEIVLKKTVAGVLYIPAVISCPLTVAFVLSTGLWLFFPELLRFEADVRAIEEYAAFVAFLKDAVSALTFNLMRG